MYVEKTPFDDAVMMGMVWKMNDERNRGLRYPDGTIKTFYPGKPWLNQLGYQHRNARCPECGQWECDPDGVGHYRG